MTKRKPLVWYDNEGDRLGVPACPECFEAMHEPGLIEACASVGIEHGKSTWLMMKEYIDAFHARHHAPVRAVPVSEQDRQT